MDVIQSHHNPDRSLCRHVDEVASASTRILDRHSGEIKEMVRASLDLAIRFHDLGKAGPGFQEYIAEPLAYRGGALRKAHTPVSLLLWLIFARDHDIPVDTVLMVAVVVWRHHNDFPTFKTLRNETLYDYEEVFEIHRYPVDRMNQELGLALDISPDNYELYAADLIHRKFLDRYALDAAAALRLKTQLLFSLLLESDRAFLALQEDFREKSSFMPDIPLLAPDLVDRLIDRKVCPRDKKNPLNQYRTRLRQQIIQTSSHGPDIESVTLPTGLGKTLIAAQWALVHRQAGAPPRKIIIVLPFLSIIDQTVREYQDLFSGMDTDGLILEAHSIAGRKYDKKEEKDLENAYNNAIDFYAETWRYDVIITTFDQFLYTVLSSSKTHLLRFHNLADALIIIDEIQALPAALWHPLNLSMTLLTERFNAKMLVMSATQPGFIPARELVKSPETIFSRQNRYRLVLNHRHKISLEQFTEECIDRIERENWHEKRVLIVLNTRRSARTLIDALEDLVRCDTHFLSADVTPKERLQSIGAIKQNRPCLVVATQCIEAGVDIDMDLVVRDFAPLDSVVQCAGRCNRNGRKPRADVEIIRLCNDRGSLFAELVYDLTLLEKTGTVLGDQTGPVPEEEIFRLVTEYFRLLRDSMDTGLSHARDWAYWRDDLDVKKLLRGEAEKIDFIVASQDEAPEGGPGLWDAVETALEVPDRWERARELRKIKARIAMVSVSTWATVEIDPREVSDRLGCFNFLRQEFYKPGRGLDLSSLENNGPSMFF